jgi:hypothetical protein
VVLVDEITDGMANDPPPNGDLRNVALSGKGEGTGVRMTHVGRIPWQADDVDGVTRVVQGGWARPGDFLRVRLDECEDLDFGATALT